MAQAIARARFLRIAPRKARLVAGLIRGKRVEEAQNILDFTVKKSSPLIRKVLDAAVANAEQTALERNERVEAEDFIIQRVQVDEGPVMKRFMPAARGRAKRIRKRMSHITLIIGDKRE